MFLATQLAQSQRLAEVADAKEAIAFCDDVDEINELAEDVELLGDARLTSSVRRAVADTARARADQLLAGR